MTSEQLTNGLKLSNRVEFYTKAEKILKATGAGNVDFSSLKEDMEELGSLRDLLLGVFSERKQAAEQEFGKL